MGNNFIVVRRSPHWPTFNLEDSRDFCSANGLPADLIVDFARHWSAASNLDFCEFREAMKRIARQSPEATGGTIINARELNIGALEADDAIIPIDDDDWLHPNVFEYARNSQGVSEGSLWGSIFVGKLFADTPKQGRQTPYVYMRDRDEVVYTNNYMISGHSWTTRGVNVVFDHGHAEKSLREGCLTLAKSSLYLSAANKHLCATTCVFYNMNSPEFVADIPNAIVETIDAVEGLELSSETLWLKPFIDQMAEVMRACRR